MKILFRLITLTFFSNFLVNNIFAEISITGYQEFFSGEIKPRELE